MRVGAEDRFGRFVGAAALVSAVGLVVAWLVPGLPEERWAALVGVGLAGASGAVALWLKRRTMVGELKGALKVVGVMFGVRAVLVGAGLAFAISRGWGPLYFVAGFFGVYFALQFIELGYVMSLPRRGPDGDE